MLKELLRRVMAHRSAITTMRTKAAPTSFDISYSDMRAAIREARDDLAAGRLRHVSQTTTMEGLGPCFCMGTHRTEEKDYSRVGLIGLVERKLGMPVWGMLDLMKNMRGDKFNDSLWDLFYPECPPNDYDRITPADAVIAIDRWLENSDDVWGNVSFITKPLPTKLA